MSYAIEYNRKIYKETDENDKNEPNYLLLIKVGDNNCREMNGQRVRDWELESYGWNYRIMEKVCENAGYCEGGSLQRAKGWDETIYITPEDYIALYRKEIKNAKPIEKLLNDFIIKVRLYREEETSEEEKEIWELEEIDEMIKKYKNEYKEGEDYYHPETKTFTKEIKNLKEFKDFLECPNWRNGENHCEWIFTEKKVIKLN